MVAENGAASLAESHREAKHVRGLWPTVDEITRQPERVPGGKFAKLEEALQGVMASLHVADHIGGHGRSVRDSGDGGKLPVEVHPDARLQHPAALDQSEL